jgi:adenylate cyclase
MLTLLISNKSGSRRITHDGGPVELGRAANDSGFRYVVDDPYISADQMRVEELVGGRFRLANLSQRVTIRLANGAELRPGHGMELEFPTRISVGETLIEIDLVNTAQDLPDELLSSVARPITVVAPGAASAEIDDLKNLPGACRMARWFETLAAIQRSAGSRADFYAETARAIVDLIGLDRSLVLFRRGGGWEVVARAGERSESLQDFSGTILERVRRERCTFFQETDAAESAPSLLGITAVVASPIFGPDDAEVVGVVYGVRTRPTGPGSVEVHPLEAQLVQVLAAAVGVGTARLGAQAEASRRMVQFEQFFSAELAHQLELQPDLLEGREREVTVMISDLRGFSKLSESLPPSDVCRLVRDVMDRITARIREHHGVVVDFAGDGVLAMWNAPVDQPDHALLACRAARAMQSELPALNEVWRAVIGKDLGLGIGINTGVALVGNTGSKVRFKYGPLGHVVNLASRIEGATKYLGAATLISEATFEKLNSALDTRRLGAIRVVGVGGPVVLHELPCGPVDDLWRSRRDAYEQGLEHFECGRLVECCSALYPILSAASGRYDFATLNLVGRAIEGLKFPDRAVDPVLELTSK